MVVGLAIDVQGNPICCELWPVNTADVTTLVPVIERLRRRFRLREVTVVADRGMVSQATLEAFEASKPPVGYIVGVRMRRQKEVSTAMLGHRGRWFESVSERTNSKDPPAQTQRSLGGPTPLRGLPQRRRAPQRCPRPPSHLL